MSDLSRSAFDIPNGVSYLNCAYLSPLTHRVVEVGREAVLRKAHPWQIVYRDFFEEVEALRRLFGGLIGAPADDIAIVPSSAYGIATAAANIPIAAGDNIVVPLAEHASTFHRWRMAAADSGAELREVTPVGGQSWTEAIVRQIDPRSRVVSVPNVHWSDGRLFDLERIAAAVREAEAALVLDGTQSIGVLPLSVCELKPDFLTCSAYKWLLCPYGLAFLYVAPHRQAGRPLEEHYFHRAGAQAHEGRLEHLDGYDRGARRFDTAERASFINVAMSVAALGELSDWSVSRIRDHIAPISEAIIAGAARHGYKAARPTERAPHLFGLRRERGLPAALAENLRIAGVYVSVRGDAIRVSPHVYNSAEDAERLVNALKRAG